MTTEPRSSGVADLFGTAHENFRWGHLEPRLLGPLREPRCLYLGVGLDTTETGNQ